MSTDVIVFSVPLSVHYRTSKRGKKVHEFKLNLNEYRNLHYIHLNAAKQQFNHDIFYTVRDFKSHELAPPYRVTYQLWAPFRVQLDLMNVCSVVDKFVCDALVKYGILIDDSYQYITAVDSRFAGIDKANPRVVVTLESVALSSDILY